MILTDDNFSTIVKAVELGRGLYDNLARYIRYQIGGLFGYIITFLSASIFNIAGGEPLLPLQTLWVSFTMLSIQSVGLGYSKPAAGLMDRPPLPPGRPILTRGLIAWLAFAGLLMAIGTLGVISGAEQVHGLAIARTMGMVTFALFLLFFSIESKDERDSAFSLDTFSDKTFLITTSVSFVLLVLSTVLGIFQTVMKTTRLDVRQWLICTAVALSIVAAAEIRKAVSAADRRDVIGLSVPTAQNHHLLNRGDVLLELAVGRGDFHVVQHGQPLLQVTTTLPREPSRSVGSQRCGAVRLAATAWTDLAGAPRVGAWPEMALDRAGSGQLRRADRLLRLGQETSAGTTSPKRLVPRWWRKLTFHPVCMSYGHSWWACCSGRAAVM